MLNELIAILAGLLFFGACFMGFISCPIPIMKESFLILGFIGFQASYKCMKD